MLTKILFISVIYEISKLDIYKCPKKCPKIFIKKMSQVYFKKGENNKKSID
jgi:hypothetical protein